MEGLVYRAEMRLPTKIKRPWWGGDRLGTAVREFDGVGHGWDHDCGSRVGGLSGGGAKTSVSLTAALDAS
jgi:hypothetical protein